MISTLPRTRLVDAVDFFADVRVAARGHVDTRDGSAARLSGRADATCSATSSLFVVPSIGLEGSL
jgi:hypothetical protein